MARRLSGLVVLMSLAFTAAAGAEPARQASQQDTRSTGKRIAWTLVGAGLGFGAGVYFGLRQFDDAINSDRKVWMSAIAGAAAGGVGGWLLSGVGSSSPLVRPAPPLAGRIDEIPVPVTFGGVADPNLARRVRAYNDTRFERSSDALSR